MARATQIGGGVQYHHQDNLGGAAREAINMVQWLAGVAEVTGTPEHLSLEADARALCLRIGDAHRRAQAELAHLYASDPGQFMRSRNGLEPWPGELAEGFEPICTCDNRCLYHGTQAPWAEHSDCNCDDICPRHKLPRVFDDRSDVPPLPRNPANAGRS